MCRHPRAVHIGLDLRDSNIHPSPNHVEVDLCVGCLLLMLEVERRECHNEFESHGGEAASRLP